MRSNTYVTAVVALSVGLLAGGCGGSSDSGTTTETVTVSAGETATTGATPGSEQPAPTATSADLPSLIPTPTDTQQTDGPDSIRENGVHMHFQVNGAPGATMDSYKTDLENKGWSVTVRNAGGGGRGGGATYTGTNNDAYGVFTGGGYGSTTDIDACVWPTKPSKTDCG